ncbi:CFF_collapsed_G0003460.mRNA.1.CDS.1 [Saccharomyces cerevisiae]|nr:CFF_collapsed_G0003460.mRNA.1.CDS.1 [Saccharomyces cerevisiae]
MVLKRGKYCAITGASDGIGKEFARQMAKRGFNLVLISRTQSKLEALQKELEDQHHVVVKILAIDIAEDKESNYESIKELCAQLPITVLVNNVGQSHSIPVPFLETEEKELRDIITINNTATLLITQIIAPKIVETVKAENKKSGTRGLILTMGSFGGLIPTPLLATYSGSKSFLQSWSNSLAGELSKDAIDVELIISYLVTSSMSKIRRSSLMIPNPQQFVKSTLRSVGRRCGSQERYATMTPYWAHAVYQFVITETFGVYSKIVNSINYSFHKSIRIRALKKAARQVKKE